MDSRAVPIEPESGTTWRLRVQSRLTSRLASLTIAARPGLALAFTLSVLTALLMGPVARDPNRLLYGVGDDGVSAPVGILQYRLAMDQGGLLGAPVYLLGAPFGEIHDAEGSDTLWWHAGALLAYVLSPVGAVNALVFFSFVATGVALYFFLRSEGLAAGPAAFGSLVYTYAPIRLAEAQEHFTLLDTFWFVIVLAVLLRLFRSGSARWAAVLGLCLALTELDNPYLGYFAGVLSASWVLLMIASHMLRRRWQNALDVTMHGAVAFGVLMAIIVPTQLSLWQQMFGGGSASGPSTLIRPLGDLDDLSLRWWHFVLPPPDNPIVSWLSARAGLHYGRVQQSIDQSTTVGIAALVLAALGLWSAFRRTEQRSGLDWRTSRGGSAKHQNKLMTECSIPAGRVALATCALLCIGVGIVFGLPPVMHVGGLTVRTPAYFVHLILPQIRTTSRIDLVIQLGVAMLAALGAAHVAGRCRRAQIRQAVLLAMGLPIALEYVNFPPWRFVELWPPPPVSHWLATISDQEAGIVANYPLVSETWDRTMVYGLYAYAVHHHRLLNGIPPDSPADAIRGNLADILNPTTPSGLASLGVNVATVDQTYYRLSFGNAGLHWQGGATGFAERLPQGLDPHYGDGQDSGYFVDAAPAPVVAGLGDGAGAAELRADGREWHWIGDRATVWVYNRSGEARNLVLWTAAHNNSSEHAVGWPGFVPAIVPPDQDSSPVAIVIEDAPTGWSSTLLRTGGDSRPLRPGARPVSAQLRSLEPAPLRPMSSRFVERGSPRLALVGWSADACTVPPGASFDVALVWTVLAPTDDDQTVFVHLLAPDGRLVSQADGPANHSVATSALAVAAKISDARTLTLPKGLPPGNYAIQAGLYNRVTGRRLSLDMGEDSVTLDHIRVTAQPAGGAVPCSWEG